MTKSVDAEISQEDKRSLLDFRTNQALNKLKDKGAIVPPKSVVSGLFEAETTPSQ
jgi:hypothetical protein